MSVRSLTLLLLLYVSLDFSNPLMPGAVSFDPGESTEGVHLQRLRADNLLSFVVPAPTPPAADVRSRPQPLVIRILATSAPRAWQVHLRRAQAASTDPGPSPDAH